MGKYDTSGKIRFPYNNNSIIDKFEEMDTAFKKINSIILKIEKQLIKAKKTILEDVNVGPNLQTILNQIGTDIDLIHSHLAKIDDIDRGILVKVKELNNYKNKKISDITSKISDIDDIKDIIDLHYDEIETIECYIKNIKTAQKIGSLTTIIDTELEKIIGKKTNYLKSLWKTRDKYEIDIKFNNKDEIKDYCNGEDGLKSLDSYTFKAVCDGDSSKNVENFDNFEQNCKKSYPCKWDTENDNCLLNDRCSLIDTNTNCDDDYRCKWDKNNEKCLNIYNGITCNDHKTLEDCNKNSINCQWNSTDEKCFIISKITDKMNDPYITVAGIEDIYNKIMGIPENSSSNDPYNLEFFIKEFSKHKEHSSELYKTIINLEINIKSWIKRSAILLKIKNKITDMEKLNKGVISIYDNHTKKIVDLKKYLGVQSNETVKGIIRGIETKIGSIYKYINCGPSSECNPVTISCGIICTINKLIGNRTQLIKSLTKLDIQNPTVYVDMEKDIQTSEFNIIPYVTAIDDLNSEIDGLFGKLTTITPNHKNIETCGDCKDINRQLLYKSHKVLSYWGCCTNEEACNCECKYYYKDKNNYSFKVYPNDLDKTDKLTEEDLKYVSNLEFRGFCGYTESSPCGKCGKLDKNGVDPLNNRNNCS